MPITLCMHSIVFCFLLNIIKAYHKANDERKNYVIKVGANKRAVNHVKSAQRIGSELNDTTPDTSRIQ